MMRPLARLSAALLLAGCNDISMTQQNRYGTYTPAALFPDGTEAQPAGRCRRARRSRSRRAGRTPPHGRSPACWRAASERYDIYCSPCHGLSGNGDGMIVRRGFPAPPSYHSARLRAAPAQHFFDVISNGYGVMYSYGARVEPRDRWAIVAYIRALQESRTRQACRHARPQEQAAMTGAADNLRARTSAAGRSRSALPYCCIAAGLLAVLGRLMPIAPLLRGWLVGFAIWARSRSAA